MFTLADVCLYAYLSFSGKGLPGEMVGDACILN